jgi:hypothetical protein
MTNATPEKSARKPHEALRPDTTFHLLCDMLYALIFKYVLSPEIQEMVARVHCGMDKL